MNSNPATLSKGNILVVDDSADNLRALSMTLTKRGYKVRCATNGETALVSIDNCLPELILLDIRMPMMDGYEVCRQLKAKPATKDIPIIFLSAADDLTGKVKAFATGGADYITKPFQTEEVLARIANQLTIQRLQSQLTEQNQRLQQEISEHERTMGALKDAKEAAEAANDAKSKFLSTMSHELRTPLNAILGFTGLMMSDSSLSGEYQDYLASISDSGQHLLKLLNHVLTVTSAESGNISLHEHHFDLHHLIDGMTTAYHSQATDDRAMFCPSQPGTEPSLSVTQERMLEALRTELSTAWLTQLHEAAIKGFDQQISQLIQELPATCAPLAQILTDWNQNFQFDRIVAIAQNSLEQTS